MLDKISELHKLCFPHKPWSAGEFAALQKSGAEIISSENGFIVWRTAADEAEIITIGVHPDHRGQGIANALLLMMEKEIANHKSKIRNIFLEVAADNAAAKALYDKHGYTQVGVRPKYYDGTPAVIMEKIF